MSPCEPFVWVFIIVRYWREIVAGCRRGWRGGRTYWVTYRVSIQHEPGGPWFELSADDLRRMVRS